MSCCRIAETLAWIARVSRPPTFGSVQIGSRSTPRGKSHSCDLPTSASSKPRAQTISVALGSSETMRVIAFHQGERPEENRAVKRVGRERVAEEGNRGDVAGGQACCRLRVCRAHGPHCKIGRDVKNGRRQQRAAADGGYRWAAIAQQHPDHSDERVCRVD